MEDQENTENCDVNAVSPAATAKPAAAKPAAAKPANKATPPPPAPAQEVTPNARSKWQAYFHASHEFDGCVYGDEPALKLNAPPMSGTQSDVGRCV